MKLKKLMGLLIGLSVLAVGSVVGHADADYDQALKTAPQGIALENIFTPGTTDGNQAAVVTTTNPAVTGTEAAKITNGKKQFGSLWSTPANTFDLTHDQTLSMWLYFGNTGKKAADGMAFVLQNDAQGLAAAPKFGKTVAGETLGVWGVDNDKKQTTADKLAGTAIQNSWALEFDTKLNKSTNYGNTGNADSFDAGLAGPHIANNYPADVGSYEMVRTSTLLPIYSVGYYATQTHQGVLNGDYTLLANGAWHHLTLKWTAQSKQMTYIFNDKDAATGQTQTGIQESATLDLAKIDPANTGQARWGFTGATGDSYENNLVVLENVPGLVTAQATSQLTDVTTGKTVANGDKIKGADAIKLTYDLTYLGGKQSWKDVQAQLQLPEHLTYDDAQIKYADGTTQVVDIEDLTNQQLTAKLVHALSPTNVTATITLTGVADTNKSPVTAEATTSTFRAVNGVATADTVGFTINPTLELFVLSLSGSGTQAQAGEDVTMKGVAVVPDGVGLQNRDMTVHAKLNGQAQPTFTIPEGADPTSGRFDVTVAAADLKSGQNTLVTTVTDPYGNVSNPVTYVITVDRQLVFNTVAARSSFEDTTLTGNQQKVKRTMDWQVEILDTREAGAKWALQVTSTDFMTASGEKLAGTLSYYDGDERTPIGNTPLAVGRGESTADNDLTNVIDEWDDEHGILLEVGGAALQGQYSGTVTWTLNDVPE